jgi:Ni/Co efflux regulator RcnB
MASSSNRWKKVLWVALTAALVVTGSHVPGEAWTRDHHRGDRQRIEPRAGERHVVDHRDSRDRHRVHHRYPRHGHPVVRDRVIIHHRHWPIGHRLWWTPRWEATFVIGGLSYYYLEGAFYRSWGTGYVTVAAPIGAYVRIPPPGCSVVYVGGTRYYYGNGAHYLWDGGRTGYVVVPPPAGAAEAPPPTVAPTVFIYPKAGQSTELQEQDRQECEEWATSETGFDPRHEDDVSAKQADYVRAMTACLEGRDYTVK